jgi:ribosomal protein L35AE/L33A
MSMLGFISFHKKIAKTLCLIKTAKSVSSTKNGFILEQIIIWNHKGRETMKDKIIDRDGTHGIFTDPPVAHL